MTDVNSRPGRWWDWRLFGLWVVLNGFAYMVIPLGGVVLEQLLYPGTRSLVQNHRALAIFVIGVIGGGLEGMLLGRWQWRLLRRRISDLPRRRWVLATVVPALAVWLIAIAPRAVDLLAGGDNTILIFRDGFIQALVLGPLIGISQATALRAHSRRWAWWLVANLTSYLIGAALHLTWVSARHDLSLPGRLAGFFPVLAFVIHGVWLLWVTAPEAASRPGSALRSQGRLAVSTSTDLG